MGGFFHGWRRKTGCVTLVMAGVLMGAWLRSREFVDEIRCTSFGRRHLISLHQGRGTWSAWNEKEGDVRLANWISRTPNPPLDIDSLRRGQAEVHAVDLARDASLDMNDWESAAFLDEESRRFRKWEFRYWPIVLPLTLLSAYLILWMPHKRSAS